MQHASSRERGELKGVPSTIGGLRAEEAEWAASLTTEQRMLAESVGVHAGVACDRCGQCPIIGYRYHLRNKDYDLCQQEFDKLRSDEKAAYTKLIPPVKWNPSVALAHAVKQTKHRRSLPPPPTAPKADVQTRSGHMSLTGVGAGGGEQSSLCEPIGLGGTGGHANDSGDGEGEGGINDEGRKEREESRSPASLDAVKLDLVLHASREELRGLVERALMGAKQARQDMRVAQSEARIRGEEAKEARKDARRAEERALRMLESNTCPDCGVVVRPELRCVRCRA